MKVEDLIKKLRQYNPKADVVAFVDNTEWLFTLTYEKAEGCMKETCEVVFIWVDALNESDSAG